MMKPCTQNSYVNGKNGKFAAASKLLMGMGKFLQGGIKGQANAVYTVTQALFEALTIKPDNYGGPRALLVLTGLPGVGKTELVNQVAKYLGLPYGRFDMSSYSDKDEGLFNFKGINESYKAAKTGDVTKFVEENPNAVLLFDELDKAHAKVLNVFYQMLEGGFIEDACMRKNVSFKNTIVFVTTNVGEELFLDVGRCNYANLPQSKIISALRSEISPITDSPCFSPALVSRFTKGKIIPFNRLNGSTLCQIAEVNAEKSQRLFSSRYPDVHLSLDGKGLAKTLVLAKVNQADARNISASVDDFLGRYLFQAMQDYEEDGGDFADISEIDVCFDFENSESAVKSLLQPSEKCVAAVYCSEEERSAFAGADGLDVHFVGYDDRVDSLEYDCAIISVDPAKNERVADYFRRLKQQDDLPVYVFSLDEKCRENDMVFYYRGGAEQAFIPKAAKEAGTDFPQFLDGIANEIGFLRTFIELSRANKVVQSDSQCVYTRESDGVKMTVKTGNYRLERVMFAEDENAVSTVHEIPDKRFSDVKGLDPILAEAGDVLEILKEPKKYLRKGIKLPKGLLLYGPPGTGKTLLAKAIAGESNMPIFEANASNFFNSLVGGTQKQIREIFNLARKYAPSMLFIDEVDAIAKNRAGNYFSDVSSQALNVLLSEMDGFQENDKNPVFVIAATNFEPGNGTNSLDPAFVRRFDRCINVELPDAKGRLEVLKYYLAAHSISLSEAKLANIVERSQGRSPADLERVVEYAVRKNVESKIGEEELDDAFELIFYGDKKEWDAESARKTAYHEAGHALLAYLTGNTPAYVTTVSRGNHGGYMRLGGGEKADYTKRELLDKICIYFAGRAAEQLLYGAGGVTTGARSDLEQARNLTYALLDEYGMEEGLLLGRGNAQAESSKRLFDKRANELLQEQQARATKLLTENRNALEALTKELIALNRLDASQIERILAPFIKKQVPVDEEREGYAV